MPAKISKDGGMRNYSWQELIDYSIDDAKCKLYAWDYSLISDAIGYNGYREITFSKVTTSGSRERVEIVLIQQQEWLVKDVFVYQLQDIPRNSFK